MELIIPWRFGSNVFNRFAMVNWTLMIPNTSMAHSSLTKCGSLTSFICLALCVPGGAFHLNIWLGKSYDCLAIIKLVSALSSRQFTVHLYCHQDKWSQRYLILSWKHPSSSIGLHKQTVHKSFKKYGSYSNVYMHPRLTTAMKIWGTTAKSQLQRAMHLTILNVF